MIDESIPIQSSLMAKSKKFSNNLKLWENFLNKESLVDCNSRLKEIEEKIGKLDLEFDNILNQLNS